MSFGERNCKFYCNTCPNPDLSWDDFYVCDKENCNYYQEKISIIIDDESEGNE